MTKLRSANAHRGVRGKGTFGPTSRQVTTGQDRSRLFRECLRDLTGVELIYAIRCPDGIIKIGHTRDLMARRRHFDSTPEAILAIKPGTYAEEQAVHASLRPHLAHGQEYYQPTPEVLAYVNDLRSRLGVEPIS
jgi:hypothetical protein